MHDTETSSSPPRGQRLSRPERREQLLDVTKRIVGEDGLHAVSIDRVAREAGISRPIVYEHFSDLGGLLGALLDREGQRALTQLAAVVPTETSAGDLTQALVDGLDGYLRAVQAEPVTWRLVLMPPEGAPEFLHARITEARAAVVAQLAALVASAFEPAGGQRSPDPELTAESMSALSDHWARLLLTAPDRYDVERILHHAGWMIQQFVPENHRG